MTIITCKRCGTKNRVDEKAAAVSLPVCGKCGAALGVRSDENGAETGSKPVTVTDATFAREVLQADSSTVLVDAWAPWCGPCRMIAPILDQLAAEASGRYRIAKLNVDENPQTAARYGIQSIPTLLIFKNGTLVDRMIGVQSKQAIAARLK